MTFPDTPEIYQTYRHSVCFHLLFCAIKTKCIAHSRNPRFFAVLKFFADLENRLGVVTFGNGVTLCSGPRVGSKESGTDPPTH